MIIYKFYVAQPRSGGSVFSAVMFAVPNHFRGAVDVLAAREVHWQQHISSPVVDADPYAIGAASISELGRCDEHAS